MKKQSNLSKLFNYAGKYKYLTMTSWVLSAVSALVALLPFVFIWRIIKEVLDVAPNYSEAQHLSYYGWMAVLFAVFCEHYFHYHQFTYRDFNFYFFKNSTTSYAFFVDGNHASYTYAKRIYVSYRKYAHSNTSDV